MRVEATLTVVIFTAAGARFALPARPVLAMRPESDSATSPVAMEALLGLPQETAPSSRLLILRMGEEEVAVRVPGEVVMHDLPAQAIHPVPELVAARCGLAGLAALAQDQAGLILLIEPSRLAAPA